MSVYIIERNVPIPPKPCGPKAGTSKYAFLADLSVGDSFTVKTSREAGSIYWKARELKIGVTQRRSADGIRVWITAKLDR